MRISLKEVKEKEGFARGYSLGKTNWLYENFRYFWVWIFLRLGFSANQLTVFWGILGVAGLFLMAVGDYWMMIIGLVVLNFAIYLDEVDGAVARLGKTMTKRGQYIDAIDHYVHFYLVFLAIGIGLFRMSGEILWFYLGVFTSFMYIFNSTVKDTLYKSFFSSDKKIRDKIAKGRKEEGDWENMIKKKGKGFFNKLIFKTYRTIKIGSTLIILTFIAIFNWTQYFLIFYAIITPLILIRNSYKVWKLIRNF